MNSIPNFLNASTADPVTVIISILAGAVPAYVWLRYWLREDSVHPEPRGLLFLSFAGGMIAVILVLPLQRFLLNFSNDEHTLMIGWVAIEEIMKLLAVFFIAFRSSQVDEPVDFPLYCITTALGFAALENALFLIYPIGSSDTTVSLLTDSLRFLGATLLHAMSTSIIGFMLGLSFFQSIGVKFFAGLFGLALAITLHSTFNFFIMNAHGNEYIKIFGFLWVATIISLLLFEKVRRMSQRLYEEKESAVLPPVSTQHYV